MGCSYNVVMVHPAGCSSSPTHPRPGCPFPLPACSASVLRTLQELGCNYLDLLMVHWPEAWLPGSDIQGEVKPDTEVTLLQTWWVPGGSWWVAVAGCLLSMHLLVVGS